MAILTPSICTLVPPLEPLGFPRRIRVGGRKVPACSGCNLIKFSHCNCSRFPYAAAAAAAAGGGGATAFCGNFTLVTWLINSFTFGHMPRRMGTETSTENTARENKVASIMLMAPGKAACLKTDYYFSQRWNERSAADEASIKCPPRTTAPSLPCCPCPGSQDFLPTTTWRGVNQYASLPPGHYGMQYSALLHGHCIYVLMNATSSANEPN